MGLYYKKLYYFVLWECLRHQGSPGLLLNSKPLYLFTALIRHY